MSRISFATFLFTAFDKGDYSTDDVLAFVLPLFKKVLGLHEAGLVAPFDLEESLFVAAGILDIDEALAHAPSNALYRGETRFSRPGVMGRAIRRGSARRMGRVVIMILKRIFSVLRLILGSMAMGVDLYNKERPAAFSAGAAATPSYHYPRIHPTLGHGLSRK